MTDTTGTILIQPNVAYVSVAAKCIICNEETILRGYNNLANDRVFVCDKCKAAIMAMRKRLEEEK